nr:MAG TPA: hypothetical protein [Caudoviricetes sp.]
MTKTILYSVILNRDCNLRWSSCCIREHPPLLCWRRPRKSLSI